MPRLNLGERGLAYDDRGEGPPIILLHGILSHRGVFDRVAERLAAEHRVIALDLRGHGESDDAADFEIASFSDDVRALIRALGLPAVILLGWSMGGAIALDTALRFPELVRHLVLVDTTPALTEQPGWDAGIPAVAAAQLLELIRSDWEAGVTAFTAQAVPDASPEARGEYLRMALDSIPTVALRCFVAVGGADLRPRLSQLPIPVSVVCGAADQVCPPAASAYLAEKLGGTLQLIPDAGHAPFLTAPEAFDAALDAVLRGE